MTPAFTCISTAVCFHGQPLQDACVIALRELYREEVVAAFKAGDEVAYEIARALLHEVVTAQEDQRQARRQGRLADLRRAA